MKIINHLIIIILFLGWALLLTSCEKENLPTIQGGEEPLDVETYDQPITGLNLIEALEKDSTEYHTSAGKIQTRSFSARYHGWRVFLVAKHSNKVLDVVNGSFADGANVQQFRWKHSQYANQEFRLLSSGDGAYFVQNMKSGKFLDVAGGSRASGANIQQYRFHGGNNQRFLFIPAGPGEFYVMNKHSRKFLDVAGRSTQDGANVQQYQFNGGSNQIFYFGAISSSH